MSLRQNVLFLKSRNYLNLCPKQRGLLQELTTISLRSSHKETSQINILLQVRWCLFARMPHNGLAQKCHKRRIWWDNYSACFILRTTLRAHFHLPKHLLKENKTEERKWIFVFNQLGVSVSFCVLYFNLLI